jgi:hypothetical protein
MQGLFAAGTQAIMSAIPALEASVAAQTLYGSGKWVGIGFGRFLSHGDPRQSCHTSSEGGPDQGPGTLSTGSAEDLSQ